MRHRLIDDALRERLHQRPDQRVVLLGAGFDTRAFRLTGGRWLELDQPALIALKEQILPVAQAPNPLQRIAIDFATDTLADKLAPWAGERDVVVVMEGVSMYLQPAQWQQTAHTLRQLLPGHLLLCDLIDTVFVRRHGRKLRRALQEVGAEFAPAFDDPAAMVAGLGYRPQAMWSIVGTAVDTARCRSRAGCSIRCCARCATAIAFTPSKRCPCRRRTGRRWHRQADRQTAGAAGRPAMPAGAPVSRGGDAPRQRPHGPPPRAATPAPSLPPRCPVVAAGAPHRHRTRWATPLAPSRPSPCRGGRPPADAPCVPPTRPRPLHRTQDAQAFGRDPHGRPARHQARLECFHRHGPMRSQHETGGLRAGVASTCNLWIAPTR